MHTFFLACNVFCAQPRPREAGVYQLLHHVVDAVHEASFSLVPRFTVHVFATATTCACFTMPFVRSPTRRVPIACGRVFFELDAVPQARRRRRRARRGWLGSLCDLAWLLRRCCPPTPPGNGGAGVGRLPRWLASREQQLWTGDPPFPRCSLSRLSVASLLPLRPRSRPESAATRRSGFLWRLLGLPAGRWWCVQLVGFRGLRDPPPPCM